MSAADANSSGQTQQSGAGAATVASAAPCDRLPAFVVRNVRKVYRLEQHAIRVLEGLNLTIGEGEWTALVGPSGCGKSTLLHLLGCLDDATAGDVLCRNRPYASLSSRQKALLRRDEIGFVFQAHHLFPELSAAENVMLPAMQWGRDRRAARERAGALLTQFGLGHRLRHRPQELSGGEQQRVALARALINSPDIILADEPTGNLDAAASRQIVDILQKLHDEQSMTVVMVTHDLGLAQLAQRVLLLRNGIAVPYDVGAAGAPTKTAVWPLSG
jgi:putative ABC transport system ATP-binding protein